MSSVRDRAMMARAIQLAWRGRYSTHPNPRVGCVIAQGDRIVGEGWHERAGEAHAEVRALSQAGAEARGATAYVTLEPCSHFGRTPPCARALIDSGVARVFAAITDPNPAVSGRGLAMLRSAGIKVHEGLLAEQARRLNPGFLKRMTTGRPWVRLKMAASLDGRTAMASGESQWITGPEARQDVQRLRAMSDAILTGVGTVLADDPALTVRRDQLGDIGAATEPSRQPLKVIADRDARTPVTSKVLRGGNVHLYCAAASVASARAQDLAALGVGLTGIAWTPQGVDLGELLDSLGEQGVNELLVEAGPTLAGAFIRDELVDELWLYQAPVFLGSTGRPTAHLPLERMAEKVQWQVLDRRQVGEDQRLILTRR
ncbi:bifunctional diaminohydroxyphosphoribosylaminopyrimidine deaminase/5-amino-6-(5-phosphoribosylamino)uracil reductase RibD [Marinobacter lutaoensis]|jgi:diaminohydroxyphosphoribosylaminopyrimidine deaminase/5-amino-6-(5-phosphoribosylamino)uracil reductase|uniref:Riboflavin biosynthesis protein RibD n=1 Tax=Marinobacter lutaoensis TaxID=135739 RepID=A0A1V2DVD4_9GAMM|nr:bifunctional diaminohydroxyphosphoribosylaminopyrimidine deaminase/5-amino-6-(5-phosphoribosylamino)uracil reductase RibD [Marinobacter lutaoensis]MBI44043.1 riboflavin biosynthesis protein RibD [Oceanospirillales bacterium]ONF44705.1 riboflavin biosynthesis protein RibD [Marinobacter lutaoensis]|tara:strand:- start:398 stop:1513 length:1116 start_codon:yes stop_codon:yes gene_type:complete